MTEPKNSIRCCFRFDSGECVERLFNTEKEADSWANHIRSEELIKNLPDTVGVMSEPTFRCRFYYDKGGFVERTFFRKEDADAWVKSNFALTIVILCL